MNFIPFIKIDDFLQLFGQKRFLAFFSKFLCNNSFYWVLQFITLLKAIKKLYKYTLF